MAARYFLNIGVNWNDTANWSTTNGGSGGASVPSLSDDVYFTALSGNCILTAASNYKSFDATGYTGTFDINTRSIIGQGNLTLGAGMTVTRTTGIWFTQGTGTVTLTSNGVLFPYLGFQGSGVTYSLADNFNVNILSVGNPCTINSNTIYCDTTVAVSQITTGTTTVVANGATTLSATSRLDNPLVINSASTITFSGTCAFTNITYTAASSVVTTGSTLSSANSNCSWNTNGITWNNITVSAGGVTLGSDITLTGTLTAATANTSSFNGAYTVYAGGSVTIGNAGSGLGGTATLIINGTGTWSSSGKPITMNMTINTAGTLTISGIVYYSTGTLTYTAGTVVTTGSTLNISDSSTTQLNLDGATFNIINFNPVVAGKILTLLSNLHCDTFVITGAANHIVNGFTVYCSSLTAAGLTSVCSTDFVLNGTGTLNLSAGLQANIEINTTGTVTFSSVPQTMGAQLSSKTFKWTAGTFDPNNASLTISPNSAITFDFPKEYVRFADLLLNSSDVITVVNDMQVKSLTITATGNVANQINGAKVYCDGHIISRFAPSNGTSELVANGSGVISTQQQGTSTLYGTIRNNLTIDTLGSYRLYDPADAVPVLQYDTGTFTYVKGKIDGSVKLRSLLGTTFNNIVGMAITFDLSYLYTHTFDKIPTSTVSKPVVIRGILNANTTLEQFYYVTFNQVTYVKTTVNVLNPSYGHNATANYINFTGVAPILTTSNNHLQSFGYLKENKLTNGFAVDLQDTYIDMTTASFLKGGAY